MIVFRVGGGISLRGDNKNKSIYIYIFSYVYVLLECKYMNII